MLSEDLRRATRPMAEFRGLSLEVTDTRRQAAFWAAALGGTAGRDARGRLRIAPGPGRPPTEILRLHAAGAPAPDDARVHLDLRLAGAGPTALLDTGADVVRRPGPDPWWVLADPEDNELCAFPNPDDRPAGVFELVVKCHDAEGLATWWATVLDGTVSAEGEAAVVTGARDFPWDYMVFDPVPNLTTAANRLRWHVSLRDPGPAELLHRGASLLAPAGFGPDGWLMTDPEGNRFVAEGSPAGGPANHLG